MKQDMEWLVPRPAGRVGEWELYPTSHGDMIFRLADTNFSVLFTVRAAGPAELATLSPCCGRMGTRDNEARYCNKCEAILPDQATDVDLVGEWEEGVEAWLDSAHVASPLTAAILAQELQEHVGTLARLRVAMHESQVVYSPSEVSLTRTFFLTDESVLDAIPDRLPWTLTVLEGLLK